MAVPKAGLRSWGCCLPVGGGEEDWALRAGLGPLPDHSAWPSSLDGGIEGVRVAHGSRATARTGSLRAAPPGPAAPPAARALRGSALSPASHSTTK